MLVFRAAELFGCSMFCMMSLSWRVMGFLDNT